MKHILKRTIFLSLNITSCRHLQSIIRLILFTVPSVSFNPGHPGWWLDERLATDLRKTAIVMKA